MKVKMMYLGMLMLVLGCKTIPKNEDIVKNHYTEKYSSEEELEGQPQATERVLSKNDLAGEVFASATLKSTSNTNASGKAWFSKTTDGIEIVVSVNNVTPGKHGIHIHEYGDCSAPDASSAGDHYNPTNEPHGGHNSPKHHVGDFSNILVNADGTGQLSLFISKENNKFTKWEEIIGRSVILHEKADDLISQPSGNSGARIACGVIEKEETKIQADENIK